MSVVAAIPAGWQGVPPWAVTGPSGSDAPSGIGVAFLQPEGLFSDPCHWDVDGTGALGQPGDVDVGPSEIDLVNALRANDSYESTTATAVTFGPFDAHELQIELPADLDLETCDKDPEGVGRYFVFAGEHAGVNAQGDGNRWHLFIVQVDDTRVAIAIPYYATTPMADQEAIRGIVESLQFTP